MTGLGLTVGPPVQGEGLFWDREEELAGFVQLLDEGASILLIAQRRIGKTSLMREAARRIEGRYFCLSVDLQADQSPADVVAALSAATQPYRDLWEKTTGLFSNILTAVAARVESLNVHEAELTFRDGMAGQDWRAKGEALFDILAGAERPVVIFLDEVPILVARLLWRDSPGITPEARAEADLFLSWLRENAIRHHGRLRFVVTGSIGLAPILERARLSATINHLTPFELGPWSELIAVGCLEALGSRYGLVFEDGACERMLALLGCGIPYHVQRYFQLAHAYCTRRGVMLFSVADAEAVYGQELVGLRGEADLAHHEERLHAVLRPAYPLGIALLTEAATAEGLSIPRALTVAHGHVADGREAEESIREVLGVLEHDGYLVRGQDGTYRFASRLVRDRWARRFGGFSSSPGRKE